MQRILSLNVETEILNLLNTILKRAGYTHISTYSSEEALEIMRTQDIALLTQNIMRPEINGCELYKIMQSDPQLRQIPLVIISALNPFSLPSMCIDMVRDLYPDHYICLPFSPHQVVAVVQQALKAAPTP